MMTKEIALDLVRDNWLSDWESIEDWVEDGTRKRDAQYYSIFLHRPSNTYWKVVFTTNYDYGLDEDNIHYYNVKPYIKTITEWVKVVE